MKFPLVPDTSPLGRNAWTPFITDETRLSYAHLLPYNFHHANNNGGGDHGSDNAITATTTTTTTTTTSTWTTTEQLDAWFDSLHPSRFTKTDDDGDDKSDAAWTEAYYKGEKLLRQTAWVALDPACQCEYGYSDTWQGQATHPDFLRAIREITAVVQTVVLGDGGRREDAMPAATVFNCCNLNYYPQGGGVGFHADDEFLFDGRRRPTCILSLSLCRGGGARKFIVKRQQNGQSEDDTNHRHDGASSSSSSLSPPLPLRQHEIILRHGDLMTMEGLFQKHYFHSVWPGDSKAYVTDDSHEWTRGERINLTWRTIVQHLDGSTECRGKTCPLRGGNMYVEDNK